LSELDDLKKMLSTEQGDSGRENWQDLTYVGEEIDGFEVVDVIELSETRWSMITNVALKGPSGKFYTFTYQRGLTEYQTDEFDSYSVQEVNREVKTVEVVEWVKAKEEEVAKFIEEQEKLTSD
jgi:hypothetical protein